MGRSGGQLRVDTSALAEAGSRLSSVSGTFVSSGGDNIDSVGVGDWGIRAGVRDQRLCEQARRVAVDLDTAVSALGTTTTGAGTAYETTEHGVREGDRRGPPVRAERPPGGGRP